MTQGDSSLSVALETPKDQIAEAWVEVVDDTSEESIGRAWGPALSKNVENAVTVRRTTAVFFPGYPAQDAKLPDVYGMRTAVLGLLVTIQEVRGRNMQLARSLCTCMSLQLQRPTSLKTRRSLSRE